MGGVTLRNDEQAMYANKGRWNSKPRYSDQRKKEDFGRDHQTGDVKGPKIDGNKRRFGGK